MHWQSNTRSSLLRTWRLYTADCGVQITSQYACHVKSSFQFSFYTVCTHTHTHTHSTVRLRPTSAAIPHTVAGARTDRSQNPASHKKYRHIGTVLSFRESAILATSAVASTSRCRRSRIRLPQVPLRKFAAVRDKNQNTTPTLSLIHI